MFARDSQTLRYKCHFVISVITLKVFYCIDKILKIFFRITGLILTKLCTKHPWLKGIQVFSNEEPCLFPKGDNYKIVKGSSAFFWLNFVLCLSSVSQVSDVTQGLYIYSRNSSASGDITHLRLMFWYVTSNPCDICIMSY